MRLVRSKPDPAVRLLPTGVSAKNLVRTEPLHPEIASEWELSSFARQPTPPPLKKRIGLLARTVGHAVRGIPGEARAETLEKVRNALRLDMKFIQASSNEELAQLFEEDSLRFAKLADSAVRHYHAAIPQGAPEFFRILEIAQGNSTDGSTRAGRRDHLISRMTEQPGKALHSREAAQYLRIRAEKGIDLTQDYAEINAANDRYRDSMTRSVLRPGNKVEVLIDGDVAFPRFIADIKAAKESAIWTLFAVDNDEVGKQFTEVNLEAAKTAFVRGLVDEAGSLEGLGRKGVIRRMRRLAQEGGANLEVAVQKSTAMLNHLTHRKAIAVDGKVLYIQDMNAGNVYKNNWHGTSTRVEGPVVADGVAMVVKQLQANGIKFTGEELSKLYPNLKPMENGVPVRLIQHEGPKDQDIKFMLLRDIDTAVSTFDLRVPYFGDPDVTAAILRAQSRGVDFRIFVPAKNNKAAMQRLAEGLVDDLTANNGKTGMGTIKYLAHAGSPMDHAKEWIKDADISELAESENGSTNSDDRSLSSNDLRVGNDEAGLHVRDPVVAATRKANLDRAEQQSFPLHHQSGLADWLGDHAEGAL